MRFCLGWIIPTLDRVRAGAHQIAALHAARLPGHRTADGERHGGRFSALAASTKRWTAALAVGIGLTSGAGFAVVFALLPHFADHRWNISALIGGAALVIAQAVSLSFLVRKKTAAVLAMTTGGLIFMALTFGSTLPSTQHLWLSREAVQIAEPARSCASPLHLVSAGYHEPSLVFLAGTNTSLVANGGDAAQALYEDPCAVCADRRQEQSRFPRQLPRHETAVMRWALPKASVSVPSRHRS